MARLDGRVCVVTGGAAGIGEAVVRRLAEEGARVAVADLDGEAAQRLADELGGEGRGVIAGRVDVSRLDDVEAIVVRTVETYGRLDGVVNNAGIAVPGSADGMSEADWDRVMSVNLKGVWAGMKFAIPHLRAAGGGSIVNMSSVQGLVGLPGWAGYAATKGAIIALTQQAAVEYGPERIRVNCIAPGTIMTPMNRRIFETAPDRDALVESWNSAHALNRFGEAEEVAAAAAFLLSDDASFVTGTCLRVDGGLTVLGPSGRAT